MASGPVVISGCDRARLTRVRAVLVFYFVLWPGYMSLEKQLTCVESTAQKIVGISTFAFTDMRSGHAPHGKICYSTDYAGLIGVNRVTRHNRVELHHFTGRHKLDELAHGHVMSVPQNVSG